MAERPWLSAIIPSHNGERWLGGALESVARQGDPGVEIVLVDASDSDRSLRIAEHFSQRLTIRTHCRPDLRSWMEKTNFGVDVARGDWICMLHQDDLWLANRTHAIAGWIADRPAAAMHLHPTHIVDEAGKRLGVWRCPLPAAAPVPAALLLERLLVQNFIAIPAPVIRRDAFRAAGGLDERLWYTADWDLYLKLALAGEIFYHDAPLTGFRIHRHSLTMSGSRGIEEFRRQMETVRDRHIDRLTARRTETWRLASASIAVNVALAEATNGQRARLFGAARGLLRLGPRQLLRYLRYSRIIERAYPRLRAQLAGRL